MRLAQGQIVTASVGSFVSETGEKGVCFDVYNLGGEEGYQIIFEKGDHCGYSQDEVDTMLDVSDNIDPIAASYNFTNVMQLAKDYDYGTFSEAFES